MDLAILQWINANWHNVAAINYIFKYLTLLGEFGIFWILTGVVLLFFKNTRKAGIAVLLSLLLNFIAVNLIIKPLAARTRPFALDDDILTFLRKFKVYIPSDASFPSGHASSSFAAAVALLFFFKKRGIPFIVLAAIISFSRIFLCVHFVTDVLAGIAIGSLSAVIICIAIKKIPIFRRL